MQVKRGRRLKGCHRGWMCFTNIVSEGLHITWKGHISNDTILERAAVPPLSEIVAKGRIRFANHILSLQEQLLASTAMHWVPEDG